MLPMNGVKDLEEIKENLFILENGKIEVKVLSNAGGRVVSFRRLDGENILLSDPGLWGKKFDESFNELV